MPRRRALQVAAAALASVAFPGLGRAASSSARSDGTCTAEGAQFCARKGLRCCAKDISLGGDDECFNAALNSGPACPWDIDPCCKEGAVCTRNAGCCGGVAAPGFFVCGQNCCEPGQDCKRGKCVTCEAHCGSKCCEDDEFCGSPKRSLCCAMGSNVCLVPNSPVGLCCAEGRTCCFTSKKAACCGSSQTCKRGTCACPKGKPLECGPHCCDAKQHCCGTTCCPKKQPCCETAAGKRCCAEGHRCAQIAGAPGNKNCCPTARIATLCGVAVCCPTGTVEVPGENACCPPGDPGCCEDGDLVKICGKRNLCVNGECLPF
jgi:hypothetical protein